MLFTQCLCKVCYSESLLFYVVANTSYYTFFLYVSVIKIKEAKKGKFKKCENIDIDWGVEDPEENEGLYCSPEDLAAAKVKTILLLVLSLLLWVFLGVHVHTYVQYMFVLEICIICM